MWREGTHTDPYDKEFGIGGRKASSENLFSRQGEREKKEGVGDRECVREDWSEKQSERKLHGRQGGKKEGETGREHGKWGWVERKCV